MDKGVDAGRGSVEGKPELTGSSQLGPARSGVAISCGEMFGERREKDIPTMISHAGRLGGQQREPSHGWLVPIFLKELTDQTPTSFVVAMVSQPPGERDKGSSLIPLSARHGYHVSPRHDCPAGVWPDRGENGLHRRPSSTRAAGPTGVAQDRGSDRGFRRSARLTRCHAIGGAHSGSLRSTSPSDRTPTRPHRWCEARWMV